MKVIEPVGTPPPGAIVVTVAVKVTACPNIEGFGNEVRVVVVLAGLMVRVPVTKP